LGLYDLLQHLHELSLVLCIEGRCRLIKEQDLSSSQ
jgi:hypothetical protein